MSTTDSLGQSIPVPTLADEPNIEALLALVNALASPGILKFQNATARAAAIPTPTHGMLTDLVDEDRIDRWDGSRWYPITPGPWHVFPYASGMVADSGSPGYRFVNGTVQFRGRIARQTGGQFTTGTEWLLGTLPVGWRPTTYSYWIVPLEMGAGIYYGRIEARTDGQVVAFTPPGATSSTDGMKWIGMDGQWFPLDTPPTTL
ncbi:hypothetical protein [Streptomyces sp. NRRL S-1813]|uniref:hypothetical protein n=1 Tax=Streptomyces sp. NRRL S-1813 TaxID=1463888 RepID=UPI0004C7702E|nr:hypothetical protein [Streptomyces sp. NRRL S-1813]